MKSKYYIITAIALSTINLYNFKTIVAGPNPDIIEEEYEEFVKQYALEQPEVVEQLKPMGIEKELNKLLKKEKQAYQKFDIYSIVEVRESINDFWEKHKKFLRQHPQFKQDLIKIYNEHQKKLQKK